MGYEAKNRVVNDRIHEIATKFENDQITERERNELATLIYPKLRYHIWKFCQNNDDTDEALQWTLKKIFKNTHKFKPDVARFTTWCYRIARNETLYYLFLKKKNKLYSDDELGVEQSAPAGFEFNINPEQDWKDLYDMTMTEINSISDPLIKNIAVDKMMKREKVKSIAVRYDINENTVKTKLRKIRAELKSKVLKANPAFKEKLEHIFEI